MNIIVTAPTSAIVKATIKELASQGYGMILLGRDEKEIKKIANNISIRYNVYTKSYKFDARDMNSHKTLIEKISRENNNIKGMLLGHGYIASNDSPNLSLEETRKMVCVNYASVMSLTKSFAKSFDQQGNFLAIITSVAGDRGKKTNLIYNSTKAAASTYIEGFRKCVKMDVIDIKPGWVDTPMTYGSVQGPMVATCEQVAKDISKAIKKRPRTLYTPFYWRYVMLALKHAPGRVWDKTKL